MTIYERIAVNLLRWPLEVREKLKAKLTSTYDRELVRQAFEKLIKEDKCK